MFRGGAALTSIGPYTITAEVARGGMGVIYRATDPGANREVAIKVLLTNTSAGSVAKKRFAREARALAKLRHKNVVAVHSVGEHEGNPYIVMDFVAGESLGERLEREGSLPPDEAAAIVRTLATALHYGHEHGVVHRDVKPSNVLLAGDQVLLTDYGLAKDVDSQTRLTETGHFLGTPGFLAPEQARGDTLAVGPTTDVYGLGATLYALLTGEPPFTGDSLLEVMVAMERGDVAPVSTHRPEVAAPLEAICLMCLEPDPVNRYPTAAALEDDLSRYLAGGSVQARRPSSLERLGHWARRQQAVLVFAGCSALLVAGVLVFGLSDRSPQAAPQSKLPTGVVTTEPSSPSSAASSESDPAAEWRSVRSLVNSALQDGDFEQATARLADPTVQSTLARGGASIRTGRRVLAIRVIETATGLHSDTMIAPTVTTVRAQVTHARLARGLLPPDETLNAKAVEALEGLCSARMGLGGGDAIELLLAQLGVAVVDLAPELDLVRRLALLSSRALTKETKRCLLPVVRRLVELHETPTHLYILSALLLELGEPGGFDIADRALVSPELTDMDRADLLSRRGHRLTDLLRHEEALDEYRRALKLQPAGVDRRRDVAKSLVELKRYEEAWDEGLRFLDTISWRGPGPMVNSRGLKSAARILWDAGGRTRDPLLMRDVLRGLIADQRSLSPYWYLYCVLIEHESGDRPAAEKGLRTLVADLSTRGGRFKPLNEAVKALAGLGLTPNADTTRAIETLITQSETLRRRS